MHFMIWLHFTLRFGCVLLYDLAKCRDARSVRPFDRIMQKAENQPNEIVQPLRGWASGWGMNPG